MSKKKVVRLNESQLRTLVRGMMKENVGGMSNIEAEDIIGKEIDGSLVCNKCFDKVFSPDDIKLYAKVTKPIKRKDLKNYPWMECESCGIRLELR